MSETRTEKLQPAEFLGTKKVFLVGSNTDETVLVAINPRYDSRTKMVSWWDTVKERMKEAKTLEVENEQSMTVVDIENNIYFFVPLSLELYNNVVKSRLAQGGNFATEEEMVKAFEATIV